MIINISRENNETISFGNSAICRIGCPVYAYQLGRTGDIRHIQYLEDASDGSGILRNNVRVQRMAEF